MDQHSIQRGVERSRSMARYGCPGRGMPTETQGMAPGSDITDELKSTNFLTDLLGPIGIF